MGFLQHLPLIWQENWRKRGFDQPSKVQERTFAELSSGKSLLGISPTGSGKTLAYLLPLLEKVEKKAGNQLLILLPSQELAMQVTKVAQEWGTLLALNVQPLIGGTNVKWQLEKLKMKPEVLVGTPGRVAELIQNRKIKILQIKSLVIDEVDQLLQADQENLTKKIIDRISDDCQISFFSATGQKAADFIGMNVKQAVTTIDVTDEDDSKGAISHQYLKAASRKKVELLRKLAYVPDFKAIVFFNHLSEMGAAESKLLYEGVPVVSLASDQNKTERKLALDLFVAGKVTFLLTTDLASRGLDFESLTYVVQYECPLSPEDYIHRTGRVGRMGKDGIALTLIHSGEEKDYQKILKGCQIVSQEVYLFGGRLWMEKPEKKADEKKSGISETAVKGSGSTASVSKKTGKVERAAADIQKVKKGTRNKKRARNQKNIGARHKKS